MRPSHLLFDLDGTLTDSRVGIVASISHAMATLELQAPTPDVLVQTIGRPLANVFQELMDTNDPSLIRAAVTSYRDRYSSSGLLENQVYPEIPATLVTLLERGFRLLLVTSKPTVYAERILGHFGMEGLFEGVFGPTLDEMNVSKGDLVHRALTRTGLTPDAAVMIGDRSDDVLGAHHHGVRAIAVTWGYGERRELEDADWVVDSPDGIVTVLESL